MLLAAWIDASVLATHGVARTLHGVTLAAHGVTLTTQEVALATHAAVADDPSAWEASS